MKIIANTERLLIREFIEQDLFSFTLVLAHPEVMKYSSNREPLTLQETKEIMDSRIFASYKQYGWGLWALIDKEDDVLIGYCGLMMQEIDGEKHVDIGYRLAHSYWGQGLATEAAHAVRDYAFDVLGLDHLVSIIEPENIASIRVAEKCGMKFWKNTTMHNLPECVYRIDKVG